MSCGRCPWGLRCRFGSRRGGGRGRLGLGGGWDLGWGVGMVVMIWGVQCCCVGVVTRGVEVRWRVARRGWARSRWILLAGGGRALAGVAVVGWVGRIGW